MAALDGQPRFTTSGSLSPHRGRTTMKTLATLLAGATLALAGSTAGLARTPAESEAKLARMLEGRTAGEPVSCISALNSNRLEVIEHVGLVYDSGATIYVARPTDPRQL